MGTSLEYNARWRAAHPEYQVLRGATRTLMMRIIKQELGCIDCGYNADPVALQFDHVDGDKLFNLSWARGSSIKLIQTELDKCVVRCANCHAIRTHERRSTNGY